MKKPNKNKMLSLIDNTVLHYCVHCDIYINTIKNYIWLLFHWPTSPLLLLVRPGPVKREDWPDVGYGAYPPAVAVGGWVMCGGYGGWAVAVGCDWGLANTGGSSPNTQTSTCITPARSDCGCNIKASHVHSLHLHTWFTEHCDAIVSTNTEALWQIFLQNVDKQLVLEVSF